MILQIMFPKGKAQLTSSKGTHLVTHVTPAGVQVDVDTAQRGKALAILREATQTFGPIKALPLTVSFERSGKTLRLYLGWHDKPMVPQKFWTASPALLRAYLAIIHLDTIEQVTARERNDIAHALWVIQAKQGLAQYRWPVNGSGPAPDVALSSVLTTAFDGAKLVMVGPHRIR